MDKDKTLKALCYLILVIGAFIPIASYVFMGILLVLIIIFEREQQVLMTIKENIPLMLLLMLVFVSSIFSELWYISTFYALLFFIKVVYFSVISQYFSESDIRRIINIILVLGVFVSVIGIFQVTCSKSVMPEWWIDKDVFKINVRAYSTFYNPNVLSVYLNLVIITSVVAHRSYTDKTILLLSKISFVTSLVCLIFTYSRAGWVSLCGAFLILGLLKKEYLRHFIIVTFILVLADYLMGVGRLNPINIQKDSSISYRVEIWLTSIKIIKDNILFGIGPGTLWDYIPRYSDKIKAYVAHSHSLYLQILLDIGIIGLMIFGYYILNIWKILKSGFNVSGDIGITSTILLTFLIVLLIHGLVDAVPLHFQVSIFIWFLLGIYNSYKSKLALQKGNSLNILLPCRNRIENKEVIMDEM
ncbi:O-antigen ligase family protein [Caldisalinibacter kiritimatiensis]|uniref:O-antigen ligase-related domain-containing protein n=1 Tax=Caldisalinibacter kiritimatiensis TaxID=1304284 RepID=R1CYZ7_9FIRM|nr:O-antigen ligase family protein [Caldisalinibacter kiritimatiensis]EOD01804.1 hypothetical protein L21TH_0122 [Caldisalinibacter kiritimatiensis]